MPAYAPIPEQRSRSFYRTLVIVAEMCLDQTSMINSQPSHRSAGRPLGIRGTMPRSTLFKPQGNKWLSDRATASSQACRGPTGSAQVEAGPMCCFVHIQPTYGTFGETGILSGCSTRGLRLVHHKADAKSFKLTGVWIEVHGLLPWVGTRTSVAMAEVLIWLPAADRPSSASLVLPL